MLGGRIMQTGAPVQDAFVEMIGPIGAPLVSYGALISIAGLNIGESIMVPRFGAALAAENSCQKGLEKQTLRMPCHCHYHLWYLRFLTLVIWLFRIISNLQCCLPFLQYIPTALAAIKLRKMYPDKRLPSECHLVLLSQF